MVPVEKGQNEVLLCPCKATQVRFSGSPVFCGYCHCVGCRTSGSLAVGHVLEYKQGNVILEKGSTLVCDVRSTRTNFACSKCGKFLYTRNKRLNYMTSAMNFIDPETKAPEAHLAPQAHMWYGERILDIKDELPKYLDLPPSLGGSGRQYYLNGVRRTKRGDGKSPKTCSPSEENEASVRIPETTFPSELLVENLQKLRLEPAQVVVESKDEVIWCPCRKTCVKFEGDPLLTGYCHCVDCREAGNQAIHHFVAYKKEQIVFQQGSMFQCRFRSTRVDSSCQYCGKYFYNINKIGLVITSAMLFLNPRTGALKKRFTPTLHLWYSERVLDVSDELPKFLDFPEALGGTSKMRSLAKFAWLGGHIPMCF